MGVERLRSEAIFESLQKGVAHIDGESIYLDRTDGATKISRGKSSVYNFFNLVPKLGIVDYAFLSTKDEDMNYGTDAWISLKPNHPFRILPVQIKSSETGVINFKKSEVFNRINQLVLVLNTRKGRKNKEVVREFLTEYDRVVSKMSILKDRRDPALDFILYKNNTK